MAKLTIKGPPATEIEVRYRGNRDVDEDDPDRDIILRAAIPKSGQVILEAASAYYVVRSEKFGTMPAPMHEQPGPMTIELK
jgi:hypothetical protein